MLVTMQRQPFLPTYEEQPFSIGPTVIEKIPRLAELVGRIAANWSGVEAQLALALGSMLGVENSAAVAVFISLRNYRAQRDALRAAAQETLSAEIEEIFDALLARYRELDKQRNQVIHGVWGRCDSTPDGIIWCSLQDYATMHITDYHMETTGQLTHESRVANMTRNLFVVRFNDLNNLNASIMALDRSIGNFHACIRYGEQSAGRNAYKALLNDPVITEKRLARKTSDPKIGSGSV